MKKDILIFVFQIDHEIKVAALFELRKQDTECLHCHSFYSKTTNFN